MLGRVVGPTINERKEPTCVSDCCPQEVLTRPSLLGFAFFLGWGWDGRANKLYAVRKLCYDYPQKMEVKSQKALTNGACFLTQELERMTAGSLLPGCLHP